MHGTLAASEGGTPCPLGREPEFFDAENMRLAKEQDHRQRIALADSLPPHGSEPSENVL
jgi:hypothetical protein